MAHRSHTQDGHKPGETMDEVLISRKEMWNGLKGQENPLRNLGKTQVGSWEGLRRRGQGGDNYIKTDRQTSEGSGVTSGTGTGC